MIWTRREEPESKVWHLAGNMKDAGRPWRRCLPRLTQPSQVFSPLSFPTMPSRSRRRYLHARTHHGFVCECRLWSVMIRAHKKTSLWRSTRKGGEKGVGGWVTVLHPGWSAPPLVGKLNIYILQLELLFSHFIFQNIDYTLPCCTECRSGTVGL